MSRSFKNLLAAGIMIASGTTAGAQEIVMLGQPASSYQGERTFSSGSSGEPGITQAFFSKPDKTRAEMTVEGMQVIQIWRQDKEVVWSLMPQRGMAVEIPFGSEQAASPLDTLQEDGVTFESRLVASENVNGVAANRYYVSGKSEDGSLSEGHIWTTRENITVRIRMTNSSPGYPPQEFHYDLTNLVVKDQPDFLFEVPASYQAISTGSAMPGFGAAIGGYAADVANDASNEATREADRQIRGKALDEARKAVRKVLPW